MQITAKLNSEVSWDTIFWFRFRGSACIRSKPNVGHFSPSAPILSLWFVSQWNWPLTFDLFCRFCWVCWMPSMTWCVRPTTKRTGANLRTWGWAFGVHVRSKPCLTAGIWVLGCEQRKQCLVHETLIFLFFLLKQNVKTCFFGKLWEEIKTHTRNDWEFVSYDKELTK